MKNILYDVVVGAVLLMALIALVPVMKANQNYIAKSALSKTNNERLTSTGDVTDKITYNILDVYAFYLQKLSDDNTIKEFIQLEFDLFEGESSTTLDYLSTPSQCIAFKDKLNQKVKDIKDTGGNYNSFLCEVEISSLAPDVDVYEEKEMIKYTITKKATP